ncbi:autotransporter outer membrane beta-barrel domain-containing protein [Chlamydia sp. 12-01]|uniref:autotransporter outer membrane beta-barrel domain-containing protein n=1 Tax=Chlamydia sp. 12-01 TaxID=3002742 RepID=UPI0035D42ACD
MGSKLTKYLTSISLTLALFSNVYADDADQTSTNPTTKEIEIKTDRKGDFVGNIFWQSAYAATSGMNISRVSLESLSDKSFYFDIEGGALGLCLYQQDVEEKAGFHMDGAGYYTGITFGSPSLYKIGFKFATQHTNANANIGHDEVASDYLSLGSYWEIHCFKGKFILAGNYLYTHGFHELNHTHRQLLGACYGSFESQTVGSALSFYFPLKARTNDRLTVIPFLRYQAFVSKQDKFTEEGARVRTFVTPDALVDVSLPFGLHNKLAFHGRCPSIWELEVAYKPTLLRQTPLVGSVLVADDGSWISSPTDVNYHAFSVNLKNETRLFKHLHINFDYQCDISSSTCSHYILGGGKLSF